MSGDLFTLRMIVVSDSGLVRKTWREAASLASVPVDFDETNGAEACHALVQGHLDILLIDAELVAEQRDAAIKVARQLAPPPFIAIAAPAGALRIEGPDSTFIKPKNTDEARALVERCIRRRIPKRILVVDDSRTMRGIVRKILSASRYALEVSEAEEGMDALKRVDTGIDIVLLDYNMPGFNGLETLAEIKRVAPHVLVVIMTANENEAIAGQAQASGAAFLKKPFYPSDIDAVLDRIYELAR